ncbi:MAG: hypothetical protein A3G18_07955 [Rhodospirillales bacterium RIFCSPLOWO2_12_FULL_58_28]|nr:MAG: hypothetical protein A3H92_05915 [Rhodospirillales bacterium RIFCSPLOWO2_02_FULL_58_16]OHC78379.1 MAG: hypothetical protein A3G18_07955 [Rhodospirillales bacterium RIFCSPLOWO2_12_FULL_58_28]
MKNRTQTIRKIVGFLNNVDEDGGFWLPNIQRPFVWSEDQICRLFDSILREYPISTLLVWKTLSNIRRRRFIDNWKEALRLSDFYAEESDKKKSLVLDGQQRLQSLFIGLRGSFEGRELYFDVLSGEVAAPDDIKYKFKFWSSDDVVFPWVKFKDLVFSTDVSRNIEGYLASYANRQLIIDEQNKIRDHIELVRRTFTSDDMITYQELDSIDSPHLYTEDDVVEVFIRANSGGTRLGKSDLLFSLLSVSWEFADEKMDDLLGALNVHGFAFDRDFVLKTCLVLLGEGARYEVHKFRKEGVREQIEEQWEKISKAIKNVLDWVRGKTFIQCDKALPSYLVLIPLIYVCYHYPKAWKKATDVDAYLLRCLLAGAFSGQPDGLIDALSKQFSEKNVFNTTQIFGLIREQGRSLELTEGRFLQMGYGSNTIHLLFNFWYRNVTHTPAYENNLPQVDHIFPQSLLCVEKVKNPETGRMVMKYHAAERDQLANCMLLSREENGAGGKTDTPPAKWFAEKDDAYLGKHLIPRDKSLWELSRFEDFIVARQKLLCDHFRYLNVLPTAPV